VQPPGRVQAIIETIRFVSSRAFVGKTSRGVASTPIKFRPDTGLSNFLACAATESQRATLYDASGRRRSERRLAQDWDGPRVEARQFGLRRRKI